MPQSAAISLRHVPDMPDMAMPSQAAETRDSASLLWSAAIGQQLACVSTLWFSRFPPCSELHDQPAVLVRVLPTDPADYRRQESVTLGPKPRTRKMIGMISGAPRSAPL